MSNRSRVCRVARREPQSERARGSLHAVCAGELAAHKTQVERCDRRQDRAEGDDHECEEWHDGRL